MLNKALLVSATIVLSSFYIFDFKESNKGNAFSSDNKNGINISSGIIDYRNFLNKLNQNQLSSISKALSYYKKIIRNLQQTDKDNGFIEFRAFFANVISNYNSEFYNNTKLIDKLQITNSDKTDPQVKLFKQSLGENGLILLHSEGAYYVDEDPNFLLNNFKLHISYPLKDFLLIRKKEMNQGFAEDGGITIPFYILGERVYIWEDFISKYPQTPVIEDAKQNYNLYLRSFLTGMDNTPVFDPVTDILKQDVRIAYYYYIKKYSNKKTGKLIQDYYKLLEKNKFKKSPETSNFVSKNFKSE